LPRKEFETVVASAPRERVVSAYIETTKIIARDTDVLNNFEIVEFKPAPNTVCEVIACRFLAPAIAGATIGKQRFLIDYKLSPFNPHILEGWRNTNNTLQYDNNYWFLADGSFPAVTSVEAHGLKGIKFDNAIPLSITYQNLTDVQQAGKRQYQIVYLEKQIVG
jgi:hypothetical protein